MSLRAYLEAEPLWEIEKYHGEGHQGALPFVGTLRKHPYDSSRCLLISEPGEGEPAIYEFRICDVAGADELPSPVDVSGQSRNLARLWVKRGSIGVRYEPFEVNEHMRTGVETAQHLAGHGKQGLGTG